MIALVVFHKFQSEIFTGHAVQPNETICLENGDSVVIGELLSLQMT